MAIIKTENLTFRYENTDRDVIRDMNIEIEQGSFVAVLGHNGCGKSTFASHLNAILLPTGGKVYIDGTDTQVQTEKELLDIRKTVGMVFQNPDNQIVATVVEEDVAFALENLGVDPVEMRKRVDETLESVGMSEYAHHATHRLSGGQKQRVAIAGVIAMRPKILVLDEPTAMLDPQGRKDVMNIIKKLHEQGTTVVLITHFMDEAAQAQRVVVMNDGKVLLDGTPHYVFENAGLLRSVGLDVPQSTDLMFLLRRHGLRVPLSVLTEDECVEVLHNVLDGKYEVRKDVR